MFLCTDGEATDGPLDLDGILPRLVDLQVGMVGGCSGVIWTASCHAWSACRFFHACMHPRSHLVCHVCSPCVPCVLTLCVVCAHLVCCACSPCVSCVLTLFAVRAQAPFEEHLTVHTFGFGQGHCAKLLQVRTAGGEAGGQIGGTGGVGQGGKGAEREEGEEGQEYGGRRAQVHVQLTVIITNS